MQEDLRRYVVVGAGRQGQAVAFDLLKFGEAGHLRLLDRDRGLVEQARARLLRLTGRPERDIEAHQVDARDASEAKMFFTGAHAVHSAVPYFLNPALAKAAVAAGASFSDLGGNTDVSKAVLALDAEAKAAKVTVTPDCGLAPGLAASLVAALVQRVARPARVKIRCGGLPQHPKPPLGYKMVFAVEGLTNEYTGEALVIRDGKVAKVPTLEEEERLHVEGVGDLEACTTSGGTSTMPETYLGQVENLDYKTIRYPGHFEKMRVLRDLGLLDLAPVEVDGGSGTRVRLAPRALLHTLLPQRLDDPTDQDLVILRVTCEGTDEHGRFVREELELVDRHDDATGFTAMERTTGFPAAMICAWQALGKAPKGGVPVEKAMPGEEVLASLGKRGIRVREVRMRLRA